MNNHFVTRCLPLLAAVGAAGCVSMSKYKTLQAQEVQTSHSLQDSQAHGVQLQQENDKLSAALAQARKQMADLASGLKSDLAQAQKGIDAALKRIEQDSGAPAEAVGSSSAAPNPTPAQ